MTSIFLLFLKLDFFFSCKLSWKKAKLFKRKFQSRIYSASNELMNKQMRPCLITQMKISSRFFFEYFFFLVASLYGYYLSKLTDATRKNECFWIQRQRHLLKKYRTAKSWDKNTVLARDRFIKPCLRYNILSVFHYWLFHKI